ncbi:Cytochrome P450 716B2 [Vitis vinifera]|uniref:Cytochrome P450 716B2 n=1 Tax=Vitis vinifera TaxID=29760 RepID=A0A438JUV8_VITVI|nr:Cytochrome P450 716B2 [Vitis vinifera]
MEFALIAAVILALFSLHFIAKILKAGKFSNLPPGSLGWPRIGETLVFLRSGEDGEPQRFIRERMDKYDSGVFKTSLLGEPMMVFCGPAGNKFLFGNENKLVSVWWPSSVRKLFRSCLVTATGDEAKRMRRMLLTFLNPDALKRHKIYYATKAANAIREELRVMPMERRVALEEKTASATQDLLSHLLVTADASGRFLTEMEIIDNILLLLFAGHDTTASAITLLIKYLGELPEVYAKVLRGQVKRTRGVVAMEGQQKMRYSWHVASEVMRLSPPASGSFREALVDFSYAGYNIPKGWKLYWGTGSTQRDPAFFRNPDNFDASRFEGAGPAPFSYIPFGGGPRMCLGQEFARLQILVFMHNIVKRFTWDLLNPDEKIEHSPMLAPLEGLPIRLHPH